MVKGFPCYITLGELYLKDMGRYFDFIKDKSDATVFTSAYGASKYAIDYYMVNFNIRLAEELV